MDKTRKSNPDSLAVAALRSLIIDTINKAKSGHPGMALDIAPAMFALYKDHLIADPAHPEWWNRDRLVYSSGHASALCYGLLHLAGYDVTLDDLKSFRQLGSKTPGHPEVGITPGVDAGAGPLGQGIAQAVGMALAEKMLSSAYPEADAILDHHTYCLCGDGCLQEGISQEAISFAGHHRLNKLILIYDENGSTLDGPTSDTLTENVKLRFLASEWNVYEVGDGNNIGAVSRAIGRAKRSKTYPSLIIVRTKIGFGSKNQGTHKTHGSPLGEEDGKFAKANYGYDYPEFTVPEEVYDLLMSTFAARGKAAYEAYQGKLDAYKASHPEAYKVIEDSLNGNLDPYLPSLEDLPILEKEATRSASGRYIKALYAKMPFAIGGAADVASSVKTKTGDPFFGPEHPESRDLNFGIRELAMAGILNGLALHKGVVPYGGLFMVFVDYCKPAIRMSAIQGLPVLYILSHDSLMVGEDGLTHEPIEQLASLRLTPNLHVFRPADSRETFASYEMALARKDGPSALILSRQDLPELPSNAEGAKKGGYLVCKPKGAKAEILATGSEVSLALEAAKLLEKEGLSVAVASLPCLEVFAKQDEKYTEEVLFLPREKRISLEMGSTGIWGDLAEFHIGVDRYGASGKASDVAKAYGFTAEAVAKKIAEMLK